MSPSPRVPGRVTAVLGCLLGCLALAGCGGSVRPAANRLGPARRRSPATSSGRGPSPSTAQDRLYLVDFTARIQAYDLDGKYLGPTWTTPDYRNGRPSGLSIDRDGNLIVSDSHYHCFRIYDADGQRAADVRRRRRAPSRASSATSATWCRTPTGSTTSPSSAQNERITKLDADGKFVDVLGRDRAPSRASSPASGRSPSGRTACSTSPTPATTASRCSRATASSSATSASRATSRGSCRYPYDLAFGPTGDLYVVEYGNHRVQKFTPDGKSLGMLGRPGPRAGPAAQPVGAGRGPPGRVHVVDTENHRVQRIRF